MRLKYKPFVGNVLDNPKYKDRKIPHEISYQSSAENANHAESIVRFNGEQGHGFAAERANHIIDKLKGKDSIILGDDNAKNGPDRMVDGRLIQSKYCKTAADSINAAFHSGKYRYIDANGHAMQIEVPKDQYEDALNYMRRRISKGQVPGVTNPDEAKNLVRQGNVDYKTACRIAKAGNIESLIYDASNGVIVAAGAFGISGAITFAKAVWNGESIDKAVDSAVCAGLQSGGMTFAASVMTSQLMRTSVTKAMMVPSIEIVKLLPSNVRHLLVNSFRQGSLIYGGAATNNLAKLMRSNFIAAGAMIVVMSAGDITEFFKGRISAKQLFKNITTLAAGVGGGYAGAIAGGAIGSALGPAGTTAGMVIGGMVGGTIAGQGANSALSSFIEDDAKEMLAILNKELIPLVEEYLLSDDELDIIIDDLKRQLVNEKLLQMYGSNDRNVFAESLLREVIENVIKWRVRIRIPSDNTFIIGLGRVIELSSQNGALQAYFSHKVDSKEIAQQLLERDISQQAARKAWYVTRQMNTINTQQFDDLLKMASDEADFKKRLKEQKIEIDAYKKEIDLLMRSEYNYGERT